MIKNKLPFTVGYELTALYRHYEHFERCDGFICDDHSSHETDDINIDIALKLRAFLIKKGYKHLEDEKFDTGFKLTDGHCIEIQSPVFTNLKELIKFYDTAWKFLKKHKFQPKHPLTVCGGNHLHFGIKRTSLMRAIIRDFISRPYITWVFTEPDDTDSCNSYILSDSILRTINHYFASYDEDTYIWFSDAKYDFLFTDKRINKRDLKNAETKYYSIATSNTGETIEFRGVEAPKNRNELLEQLEFFISYVLWVEKEMKNRKFTVPTLLTPAQLQAIKPKDAIKQFNDLLGTLGLDKKKYAKYIKRNLLPRWKLGRARV